jgi:hypothetical protein
MSHYRWSDNDRHFGPFLYAPDKYRNLACVLSSGDDEDYPGCRIRISAFGHTVISALPTIIKPWKRKVMAHTWDQATVDRMGRDWYWDKHSREYGISYGADGGRGGFLQVFLGAQTHDSSTTQSWSCFIPWNNWRHVRHSFYDLEGNHFWTEPELKRPMIAAWEALKVIQDSCPSRTFAFTDFDGEKLTAKTRIEEREWRLGTGWFKWMSWFSKPKIHRSLDIDFSGETGRRKGSWKGGTTGHSIEMLPGELHEAAFKRYCAGDDTRHGKKRDMVFVGEVE